MRSIVRRGGRKKLLEKR